jgi:DNA-3-methyladenine glycosylase I
MPERVPERRPSVKSRCWWCGEDPLYCEYHDKEWGVPIHDDRKIFEMLILEGFQAGLSWITILRKRENFRKAFKNFDPRKVARFGKSDVARLMRDAGIIRNPLKIKAAITNARCFLDVQKEFGSFDRYVWRFTRNQTLRNPREVTRKTMKATSPESDALSKDLKQRGFKFVGPTVCQAHMQATGMVDDHVQGCFKYRKR